MLCCLTLQQAGLRQSGHGLLCKEVKANLSKPSGHLMAIVRGMRVLGMREIAIWKGVGLMIGLGLQEVSSLLCCHQVHVAACTSASSFG